MGFLIAVIFLLFVGMTLVPPAVIMLTVVGFVVWFVSDGVSSAALSRPALAPPAPFLPPRTAGDAHVAAIRAAIPNEQPIRRTLLELTDELLALDETAKRARRQGLPGSLVDQFQARQRESWRLAQESVERVGAVTQGFERLAPPAELVEALTRQDEKLSRLTLAVRSARGVLASVIVTGIGDRQELERTTASLRALTQAMCEAMAIGLADDLAFCHAD